MMSSRMAAHKAFWDLIKTIGNREADRIVFRPYSQMSGLNLSRTGYNKRLLRFKKYGLITKKRGAGDLFVISKRAKFLRSKAIVKKRRPDEFATLIIFDVPESKRNARDTFRRYLIRNGYTQIKESCFISPFEILQDMKDLIGELKLQNNISVFSAKMELNWF